MLLVFLYKMQHYLPKRRHNADAARHVATLLRLILALATKRRLLSTLKFIDLSKGAQLLAYACFTIAL